MEAMDTVAALSVEPVWQALSVEGRLVLSSTCRALRAHLYSVATRVCARLPAGDAEAQRQVAALVGRLPHLRHLRATAPSKGELLALLRRCAHCRSGHVLCASFLWMREPGAGAQAGAWEVLVTLEQVCGMRPTSCQGVSSSLDKRIWSVVAQCAPRSPNMTGADVCAAGGACRRCRWPGAAAPGGGSGGWVKRSGG